MAKIYQIPCDDEDAEPELVANSISEFLTLLNEGRVDVENNYFHKVED